jgi:hypothetical protein
MLIIIAALGSHSNADTRPLDGSARASLGVRRMRVRGARQPGSRKRHEAIRVLSSGAGRHAQPNSQPAHMAPQPEDIPPVKPPKRRLPPADKRNPRQ